jgi:23S rRNA (adenine-N6)-dimethyltransferase
VAERPRTKRDARRRALAQNFLRSRALADKLVREAEVSRGDLVLELGAGTGVLTAALARRAARVLAVELDPAWAQRLLERFAASAGVFVVQGDALRFPLPGEPFRVVANLPFNRTTALMRRLLDDPAGALTSADFVVQEEVARKRARNRGAALTVSWAPWFEFALGARLPPQAFRPVPRTRAAVLRIRRRAEPLLPAEGSSSFARFVRAGFERDARRASKLSVEEWIRRFRGGSLP